ncbi:MAG: hypothetical protein FWC36_01955 [Spirochaetes bacterium]|nr:hypothetical protein [Spirochaetota bacterium]
MPPAGTGIILFIILIPGIITFFVLMYGIAWIYGWNLQSNENHENFKRIRMNTDYMADDLGEPKIDNRQIHYHKHRRRRSKNERKN